MEPERPPDVHPDQRQLVRGAPGELRDGPGLHPRDALVEGIPRPCPSGYDRLSHEVPSDAGSQEAGAAEAAPRAVRVELHHLPTRQIEGTLKLILDSNLVVRPEPKEGEPKKFEVLPWRWIVERTFAWLGRYRRLSKDYEGTEESSESWIYLAMTHLMLRRLDPA